MSFAYSNSDLSNTKITILPEWQFGGRQADRRGLAQARRGNPFPRPPGGSREAAGVERSEATKEERC